jgi:hypothetical protein
MEPFGTDRALSHDCRLPATPRSALRMKALGYSVRAIVRFASRSYLPGFGSVKCNGSDQSV